MINISLCMIVRNEELSLDRCLSSIAEYADEIVIVDTGSTDKTKEIALHYTDKVYDFAWINDFSAARNYSISKAENEFILLLDSDEFLESIDINSIKSRVAENPRKIGRLNRINEFTRKGIQYKSHERVNRLFSKKYFKYEGIIHEQVVPISKDTADSTYNIPLTVRHIGYEGTLETRKKKTERNITLLKKCLEENPKDPYLFYQLGKSFYMEEDYQSAYQYFDEALYFDLNPKLEYVQDLVESYGYAMINTQQYEKAMQLLNIYDEFSDSADFIFLIALILMNNGNYEQAINEFLKATQVGECHMEGVNDFLAFYNIAVVYDCLGNRQQAMDFYKKCKNYSPALKRLSEMTKEIRN